MNDPQKATTSDRRALIAYHHELVAKTKEIILKLKGYSVTTVGTLEEVLDTITRDQPFHLVMMDTNLDRPGEVYCESAERVLETIRSDQRYASVAYKFISSTGSEECVELARKRGIPVILKGDHQELMRAIGE